MSPIRIRLRELRTERELTQQALAELAGVRQATVSEIESGTTRIELEVLERLADALGVEPGELFERRRGKGR